MSARSRFFSAPYSHGAEAALGGLMVLCPLALGGAPAWVLGPVVGLSGLALALACASARRRRQRLHLPPLAWVLGAGAALCLLQLVPLPPRLLAALSPEAAALRDFALVPLGLERLRPLSLEPPGTWRALALYLGCWMVLVAAGQVSQSRRARRRLLVVLAATGAGLAALGLLHALLGLESLLGVFTFTHARPPLMTPFGNPNHLAAFLGLSSTVAAGLALSAGSRERAAAFTLAALVSGVGVLLSLSRGGIAFFLFSQLLLGLLLVHRRSRARTRGVGLALLACLLVVLAVGGSVTAERLAAEWAEAGSLRAASRSKVEHWPAVAALVRAYPLGIGRGAFEAVFPRYQQRPEPNTLAYPENALLQLGAELGAPGLLLLGAMGWAWLQLLRREGLGPAELGGLAGVAGLALHDCFDFSLELPACAVAALVVLATAGRPEERERSTVRGGLAPARGLVAAVALTALGLGALWPGRHTLAGAEAELQALVAARTPLAQVRARGLALIDRHPAAHSLQDLLGMAHATAGPQGAREALGFANRALLLHPGDAAAHRVAARALLSLGRRAQAFLEYRLAHEAGDGQVLLQEALGRARTLEELQALTPDSVALAQGLAAALAARPGGQALALGYLAWACERLDSAPGVGRLWEQLAWLRLGRRKLEPAEAAWAELARREPEALATHLLHAEVLRAQGHAHEALQALELRVSRDPGEVELAFTLARHQLEAGLARRARETLQRVAPALRDQGQRARLYALEAETFEREGSLARALEDRMTVTRLAPGVEAWLHVARLHEALQQLDAAAQAVRAGLRLLPPEAGPARAEGEAWVARLEAEERRRNEGRRQRRTGGSEESGLELLLRGPAEGRDGDEREER